VAGSAPDLVWTFFGEEEICCPYWDSNPRNASI